MDNIPKNDKNRLKLKRFLLLTIINFTILFSLFMPFTVVANTEENEYLDKQLDNTCIANENEDAISYMALSDQEETKVIKEEKSEKANPFAEIEPTVVDEEEEPENYTEDDLYYLAAAVCCEAGGENEEIQLLVANVVINRVNSSLYPDTIYDVLTEYGQYGMMWEYGIEFPDWADEGVKNQCYSVARRVLEGERFCPENVLFQAEFEQGSGIFKQFGDEYYFCYYD